MFPDLKTCWPCSFVRKAVLRTLLLVGGGCGGAADGQQLGRAGLGLVAADPPNLMDIRPV